eukprot:754768-Hanusia_phi.AAC.1
MAIGKRLLPLPLLLAFRENVGGERDLGQMNLQLLVSCSLKHWSSGGLDNDAKILVVLRAANLQITSSCWHAGGCHPSPFLSPLPRDDNETLTSEEQLTVVWLSRSVCGRQDSYT